MQCIADKEHLTSLKMTCVTLTLPLSKKKFDKLMFVVVVQQKVLEVSRQFGSAATDEVGRWWFMPPLLQLFNAIFNVCIHNKVYRSSWWQGFENAQCTWQVPQMFLVDEPMIGSEHFHQRQTHCCSLHWFLMFNESLNAVFLSDISWLSQLLSRRGAWFRSTQEEFVACWSILSSKSSLARPGVQSTLEIHCTLVWHCMLTWQDWNMNSKMVWYLLPTSTTYSPLSGKLCDTAC